MRITTVMMGRKYQRNLQAQANRKANAETTASDFRKFRQVSDDPASASKAFQLRREISRVESHKHNAEMAEGRINTAESSLVNVQELLKDVHDRLVQGNNGTLTQEDRATIATELRGIQNAIIQDMNVSYSGQYLFGGEKTDEAPIKVGEDGKLLFRGMPLEPMDGETEKEFEERMCKLENERILIDFGYGIDTSKKESGFDICLSAVNLLGRGKDEATGFSNNLYNLAGEMAKYLEDTANGDYDHEHFGTYMTQYEKCHDKFLNGLTNMGEKEHTIEYAKERLASTLKALQEKQSYVETVDPEEALSDYKYQEFAYRAALAIGTKVLQPSLLDYMN